MERTITCRIPAFAQNLRIEQYLRRLDYSHQNLTNLKQSPNEVMLNGVSVHLTARIHEGDILTLHMYETEVSKNITPVNLPLEILYEDDDILVANKPAGMPTHPSMHNTDNSLANALAFYYLKQGKPFVFRCTNRLDRDTSGLTIVAKHAIASAILSAMVKRNEIHREYVAVVSGFVTPATGTIRYPLSRKDGSIIERIVDTEHGEPAVTHYQLLTANADYSLVSLHLETGRTHQIRIHMKALGFPLVGDYLYNPDMRVIHRQALHSYRMTFPHPITREPMEFTSAIPRDMQAFDFDWTGMTLS